MFSLCVGSAPPLGPLIRAACIYIQWQEKVNAAVINSCISIRERRRSEACWETDTEMDESPVAAPLKVSQTSVDRTSVSAAGGGGEGLGGGTLLGVGGHRSWVRFIWSSRVQDLFWAVRRQKPASASATSPVSTGQLVMRVLLGGGGADARENLKGQFRSFFKVGFCRNVANNEKISSETLEGSAAAGNFTTNVLLQSPERQPSFYYSLSRPTRLCSDGRTVETLKTVKSVKTLGSCVSSQPECDVIRL